MTKSNVEKILDIFERNGPIDKNKTAVTLWYLHDKNGYIIIIKEINGEWRVGNMYHERTRYFPKADVDKAIAIFWFTHTGEAI